MKTMLHALASLLLAAASVSAADGKFTLSSRNVPKGGYIPAKHATSKVVGGKNISPSLWWANAPKGTKSFAILCVDTNPVARRWVHWMVVDIPPNVFRLKMGVSAKGMPKGAIELENSFGDIGWGGPQPPRGTGLHRYVFTIFALNVPSLKIPKGSALSEKELLAKLKGHVLGKAILVGLFER